MDREKLDGWCEKGILGLVLAMLVYGPLATGMVRPQDFVVVQWLTLAAVLVWLFRFWVNPKHRLLWSPLCWAVLAFVIYAIGRYWKADVEYLARQELIKVLIYALLFFLVLTNLHKQDTTHIVGLTLIGLAAAIALYAVVQFLTESDRVWHFVRPDAYTKRGSGTFICPNNLAGYLEMLLPLGLACTLTGRFGHVTKVMVGYASLAIFTGIVVSVSRGGWMATVLTMAVLFICLMKQRGYRMQSLLLLGGLILIVVVFFFQARLSQNRYEKLMKARSIEDVRVKLWGPAVKIWQENFWWGAGPAHFDYRFRQHRPADDQLQARPDRVHNDYLNTLADWGLVGAVLVAAAWGIFYWQVFRAWPFVQRTPNDLTSKRSNKASFVLGGALGLLAILFHSFLDFNMHIPANAMLAVTLMAIVAGHFRFATERYWVTLHAPMRGVVTVVLLGALGYLGVETWRRTRECHWLVRAEGLKLYTPEQTDAFRRAFAADGKNFEAAHEVGECLRMRGWDGGDAGKALVKEAMTWFKWSMEMNPFNPHPVTRYGMCLDWLGEHEAALACFKRAQDLDPNGYLTVAYMGWHYIQLDDFAAARTWFEKSLRLNSYSNDLAVAYLKLIDKRLTEPALPR